MSNHTGKAIIISGLLTHLSDNFIPFLDKSTDVYCHTWDIGDNKRWLLKLNRYKKYCRNLYAVIENPKFTEKRLSYFYSTYRVVNMIKDIDLYDSIVKFKPNVDGKIQYEGDISYYFTKASIQSRPLLKGISKEECLYGTIHYQTMDERMFTGYPLAFKKMFHILEEQFLSQFNEINSFVKITYGEDSEGSLFWKEWAERKQVKFIQDLDLKIPNSKSNGR